MAEHIVVIGGGNTAIDIAVQSKRLGAEHVTIAYRRGPVEMGATHHEQEFAQTNGVVIRHWMMPSRIVGKAGRVTGIELERTMLGADGRLAPAGALERLRADAVFLAIGQHLIGDMLTTGDGPLALSGAKIEISADFQTSVAGIYAGGDCVKTGEDLTVQAVEDGKRAAAAIHSYLS